MTAIVDALTGLGDIPQRMASLLTRQLPNRPKISIQADAMADGRIGKAPSVQTLNSVADAMRRVDSRLSWNALPVRIRRVAPWALWTGDPPPIRHRGVLGCCRDDAMEARGTARVRSLIGVYLTGFNSNRVGIAQLGGVIRDVLQGRPHLTNWRDRDQAFSLFDPKVGPNRVAIAILGARSPGEVLHAVGLEDPSLAGSGFMGAVHDELCLQISAHLPTAQDERAFSRLVRFLEGQVAGLRFPERRALLASSLLQPWVSGATPALALRDAIIAFLLRHLRDPRMAPESWSGVPANCVAVFRKWIARASLEEFFELISDRNDSNQWPYRRAFWSAVARTGAIEDAWVVLSPQGRRVARGKLGSTIACGEISSGFANDQSVILLHIGSLILAEVSHNGRLHAWRFGSPNAPVLARSSYDRGDVYSDGIDFPRTSERGALSHRMPANNWWQERAAELLRSYTGLRLGPRDWRV